jgi:hypothetical protein
LFFSRRADDGLNPRISLRRRKTALLSQEGSGIAKRIPRGVVPEPDFSGLRFWNHPGASRHPS